MMKFKGKIAVVTGGAQQPAGRVGNPLDIANIPITEISAGLWPMTKKGAVGK